MLIHSSQGMNNRSSHNPYMPRAVLHADKSGGNGDGYQQMLQLHAV